MDTLNRIVAVDWSALNPNLIQAINEGKAVIRDGVAYWEKGSGNNGIIQHLPFKEVAAQNVEEAIKMGQATTAIVTAVSTGVILAAIVVQTRYLAAKLDKIQETVDIIAKDIHAQNIIFYMDRITDYVGYTEFARTLLKDRSLADEIHELAYPLLSTLASNRNKILSFVDNILNLAKTPDVSPKNYELILNFAQMMLGIIPASIHIEYLLTVRIGKPQLAEHILIDGAERYYGAIGVYRAFLNDLHRDLVNGQIGDRKNVYQSIETLAMQLIKSEENKILLSLQGRVAPARKAE